MAQDLSFRDVEITPTDIHIRKIGVQDLWKSLKEGYDDFNAKPTFGVFLTVIYPLFALLMTLLFMGDNLLQLAFPMVAGFTLLGPMVLLGLMEMSRRREQGLEVGWHTAFGFIHSAAFAPIMALSVLMMLLYAAWVFMAQFIYTGLFGTDVPASLADFAKQLVTTRPGWSLILYGNGVGFVFAFSVLAISVVSFPLLLDRPASSITAASVSTRAVTTNFPVMMLWGLIVVVGLAAGAILFLIGLAYVLPILGHATWHLYRRIVEP